MQKSQDCVELQNPTYLLVLDFRSLEEWLEERLVTSLHHERLQYLEKCLHYKDDIKHHPQRQTSGNLVPHQVQPSRPGSVQHHLALRQGRRKCWEPEV